MIQTKALYQRDRKLKNKLVEMILSVDVQAFSYFLIKFSFTLI